MCAMDLQCVSVCLYCAYGFGSRMYAGIVWVIWMYRDYVECGVCAVCKVC